MHIYPIIKTLRNLIFKLYYDIINPTKQKEKFMLSTSLNPQNVFKFFEQLAAIPHGSGNMCKIAQFCENFAKEHALKCVRDNANNVIIYKNGTAGYENSEPVILQGHLDMVCQKALDCNIDFETEGLQLCVDGDFLKANGTTLGADNGIAVAMILAILESDDVSHPPIEAVFTTDEETGMNGALALDATLLKGKRMINLDEEKEGQVTVSCAGGSDFVVDIPLATKKQNGLIFTVDIKGLKGGHSGIEIHKNRVNANMLAGRFLNELKQTCNFDIISINGGDKANAIPNRCVIELCVKDDTAFCSDASKILADIKAEISDREGDFVFEIENRNAQECFVFEKEIKDKLIYTLLCAPNGVVEMSADIDGLVQTSLNLGILATNKQNLVLHFALRSSKMSAIAFLQKRLCAFFDMLGLSYNTFGHYPAWEYRENSPLRDVFIACHKECFGIEPKTSAIHAGLECGVFASKISDFDCIAIGPTMHDVHTTRERLSISSTNNIYNLLLEILKNLK